MDRRRLSKYKLWVFRQAGPLGGAPIGSYDPVALHEQLPELIRRITGGERPEPLRYDVPVGQYANSTSFVIQELRRGRLRQGWGVPGLNLSLERGRWILNYIFGAWKYWEGLADDKFRGALPEIERRLGSYARQASGRYNVLLRMCRMGLDDVVFVPRTAANDDHQNSFTVAVVAGPYSFEDRSQEQPHAWAKDFGHRRLVNRVQSYRYSPDTLLSLEFQPFRYAVNGPIGGKAAQRLEAFLSRHYPL